MEFLKRFFNDESTVVGLCGFNLEKRAYNQKIFINPTFLNPFQAEKVFETNLEKNVLLF